ncbi:MAG TPA: DoxX family protein [Rhizomicrobium sp.]|nr:DoxX family protein [Rhizomicrobium sp.]
MSFSEYISPLIGRLVLAWFYLSEAVHYAGQWDATVQLMALRNMPVPPLLLALTIIALFLGGLALVLGFHTRHGALLLFAFTIAASLAMHNFWQIQNPLERAADYEIFSRNMAIAGALLVLVGIGPGPIAIDTVPKKKK